MRIVRESRAPAVLAFKPGHDGAAAAIVDGKLLYSLEGEKDSRARHSALSTTNVLDALREMPVFPEIIATGGWRMFAAGRYYDLMSGYQGLEPGALRSGHAFGRDVLMYSSSHERSHVYCGVGLAPFDPEGEIAVLVWEGVIGAFYQWRGPRAPLERIDVLNEPGARYAALYCLADPRFPEGAWPVGEESAGKLMALAGLADDRPPSSDSVRVVETILALPTLYPFYKGQFRGSPLLSCGLPNPELCRAARYLSDRIFEIFRRAAERHFTPRTRPLVITGGCGLNCDWNAAWRATGLFTDIFVPPCPDDSGSAIGTALDAAVQAGAPCRVEWDVYRGPHFLRDSDPVAAGWRRRPLDPAALSGALESGAVVAWVQGRCEIGPRALGNRSLLASAADPQSHARLNGIKQRESYRPIAPVCLEEDLHVWFDEDRPDPHMLYFRRVRDRARIPAVTHADGSARVQSVTRATNPRLHELLRVHRERTGIGVLCNTSLNYLGTGFINRVSDLLNYCTHRGVQSVVIDDEWYVAPA